MGFQGTRIYQRGLELVALSQVVIEGLPVGTGFLADQLRRASASVVLNFAEGHDKSGRAEQLRFFNIARGSAQETYAIFDVAQKLNAIADKHHIAGIECCDHLIKMLAKFRR